MVISSEKAKEIIDCQSVDKYMKHGVKKSEEVRRKRRDLK